MNITPTARIVLLLIALVLFVLLACGDIEENKPMPGQSGLCQYSTLFCSNAQIEDEIENTLGLE